MKMPASLTQDCDYCQSQAKGHQNLARKQHFLPFLNNLSHFKGTISKAWLFINNCIKQRKILKPSFRKDDFQKALMHFSKLLKGS